MSKKIYIIRHGETDLNKKGIVQGSGINSSLNEKGKRQALLFYEKYKHVPFDNIYASTLSRTEESVISFLDNGRKLEKLEGLNEINWGSKEGKPFDAEGNLLYQTLMTKWRSGEVNERIDTGESPLEVFERQSKALEVILSREEEKLILISTHGRAMRILLCNLLNYDLSKMDVFEHQNLCLYILNYSGGLFSIELYNDKQHLLEP